MLFRSVMDEQPKPTFVCQSCFGPAAGHCVSQFVSVEIPLRLGPRHCGQSAANAAVATSSQLKIVAAEYFIIGGLSELFAASQLFFMGKGSLEWLPACLK